MVPMSDFFLIRISKADQQDRKEREGRFYFPSEYAYMQRELQYGEIIGIGKRAAEWMPQAEIGDYLLIHHMVSGKKTDKGYCFYFVTEDKEYNYYGVNAYEMPGEMPLAYGIAKGEDIIPTPDYIFLEVPQHRPVVEEIASEGIIAVTMSQTREQIIQTMKDNLERCRQLAPNLVSSEADQKRKMATSEGREKVKYATQEIQRLQAENERLSKQLNKRRYESFVVAAINPDFNEGVFKIYGRYIEPGQQVYMLGMACKTVIDFSGTPYIVANTKYFGCPYTWLKKHHDNFKHSHAAAAQTAN